MILWTLCFMLIPLSALSGCCPTEFTRTTVPGRPPERGVTLRHKMRKWRLEEAPGLPRRFNYVIPVEDMDLLLLDRKQWRDWALAQHTVNQ